MFLSLTLCFSWVVRGSALLPCASPLGSFSQAEAPGSVFSSSYAAQELTHQGCPSQHSLTGPFFPAFLFPVCSWKSQGDPQDPRWNAMAPLAVKSHAGSIHKSKSSATHQVGLDMVQPQGICWGSLVTQLGKGTGYGWSSLSYWTIH